MTTYVRFGGSPSAPRVAAWAVAVWALLSIVLVAVGAPQAIRLPVVAPFALLGVGVAAVVRLRDVRGPSAWAMALALGLGGLILISASLVYAGFSGASLGLATVTVQGGLSILLVAREALGRTVRHAVA